MHVEARAPPDAPEAVRSDLAALIHLHAHPNKHAIRWLDGTPHLDGRTWRTPAHVHTHAQPDAKAWNQRLEHRTWRDAPCTAARISQPLALTQEVELPTFRDDPGPLAQNHATTQPRNHQQATGKRSAQVLDVRTMLNDAAGASPQHRTRISM